MLNAVTFHRFKQFRDHRFDLKPAGCTLVAGGNNAGKSSLLHGLAVWEFCRTAIEMERGRSVFSAGSSRQGLGLGDDQFSPVEVPSLNHLWTSLRTQRDAEPDGYTLKIRCDWTSDLGDRFLEFGLALANDRLFIKATASNLGPGDQIPRLAYLPPFAGITAREMRLSGAIRRRRIGEGLAGAVLRNLLLDLFQANASERARLREGRSKISDADLRRLRDSDPWELLQSTLRATFGAELDIAPFSDEYHSYIQVEVVKGVPSGFKLKRHPGYRKRDLMVEGSGFLQWLSVYALATNRSIDVLLLDEPDAHLHTALQQVLLDDLSGLADQTAKQVLIATHSPELLKNAPPENVLEVRQGGTGSRYLTEHGQKVGLLAGLGSEYAPRIDRVRRTKRLLFVEGSDCAVLEAIAETAGITWPDEWVEWRSTGSHSERKQLFLALSEEIPGLKAYSLRDRDDDPLKSVGPTLEEKGMTAPPNFLPRKWRRRYLESYLVWPPAISVVTGMPLGDVEGILRDEFGVAVTLANFKKSAAPTALLDLRAKDVMSRFGVNAKDVARKMERPAIPEDFLRVVTELNSEL